MKTYNEWNRLKLTFAEKCTLLQNRFYQLSSAYANMSSGVYPVSVAPNPYGSPVPEGADLVAEMDEIWAEIKSDMKEAKSKKKKAGKK